MCPYHDLDSYREFLEVVLSNEGLSEEYLQELSRKLRIIDAMTALERRDVEAMPRLRVEQIARDSGTSEAEVTGFMMQYLNQTRGITLQRGTRLITPCDETHAKLIAGTCPWCREVVSHGRTAS